MIQAIFVLLVAYQAKHFLADYIFQQNNYMLGKFKPGWAWVGPLLAHVAVHFAGTLVIGYAFLPRAVWGWAWLVAGFDAVVHFCMDRIKASPAWMGRWKSITGQDYVNHRSLLKAQVGDRAYNPDSKEWVWYNERWLGSEKKVARKALRGNSLFWCALGFDQMVHHLTHYACIYFFLRLAGLA
jgi:hypothetical protein